MGNCLDSLRQEINEKLDPFLSSISNSTDYTSKNISKLDRQSDNQEHSEEQKIIINEVNNLQLLQTSLIQESSQDCQSTPCYDEYDVKFVSRKQNVYKRSKLHVDSTPKLERLNIALL
ncbi:hypothetical protein SS50377_26109 [Spironucleus salmonicida]|uniref:Uncharacterized protein n=1 Tax=Spironucleus salmonicida TaxID=348837 RepID=V6LV50_9EUKA|nr:hypothetical protein SS50377_26109 [Spironucleus salmonicida]|eukprot:EST48133.1 Hypothetical protein SS50377_11734 [Spironucleus salmonicida]